MMKSYRDARIWLSSEDLGNRIGTKKAVVKRGMPHLVRLGLCSRSYETPNNKNSKILWGVSEAFLDTPPPPLSDDAEFKWMTNIFGRDWEMWQPVFARTFSASAITSKTVRRLNLGRLRDIFILLFCEADVPRDPVTIVHGAPTEDDVLRAAENAFPGYNRYAVSNVSELYRRILNTAARMKGLAFPFPALESFGKGKTKDTGFFWLTYMYGEEYETWRQHAGSFIDNDPNNAGWKMYALQLFFEDYVVPNRIVDLSVLFAKSKTNSLPDLYEIIARRTAKSAVAINNRICDFCEYIFATMKSQGYQDLKVPFARRKDTSVKPAETPKANLPYPYIAEMRRLLCPDGTTHFRDWCLSQKICSNAWFIVDPARVDATDPDCVWRRRYSATEGTYFTELWWPGVAVALFVHLHLPLRHFQVRMLDSGEADTERYVKGQWERNQVHPFARAGRAQGVFNQFRDSYTQEMRNGLFINTNKTGMPYLIPWEHPILYWLEKLRNWQEKYNPIQGTSSFADLEKKHFGAFKHDLVAAWMGDACFLFRDASAYKPSDRAKPMPRDKANSPWTGLLKSLEDRLAAQGETLSSGASIWLTKTGQNKRELLHAAFSLHGMRVSLITAYYWYGAVPAEFLSKVLVGHQRIIMTLHYAKSDANAGTILENAEKRLRESTEAGLTDWLDQIEVEHALNGTAYTDRQTVAAALEHGTPAAWTKRMCGVCLAGGQVGPPGCANGGEILENLGNKQTVHAAVPHYQGNCVRCRWFVTDASFLEALVAWFNTCVNEATNKSELATQAQGEVEELEDERANSEADDRLFDRHQELRDARRRYERAMQEADEWGCDLAATWTLIHQLMLAEEGRQDDEDTPKLVAPGDRGSIREAIGMSDMDSQVAQEARLLMDAEVYTDLADALSQRGTVYRRSQVLDRALRAEGNEPVMMNLSQRQQLMAGNALMRRMARRADPEDPWVEGVRRVIGIMESGESLRDAGYLEETDLREPLQLSENDRRKLSSKEGS